MTGHRLAALVTVVQPEFLAVAAREFPLARALEIGRDGAIAALPVAEQRAVARRPGAELFRDLRGALSPTHQNPRPTAPAASAAPVVQGHGFDLARWRLVAVRPRLDTAVPELRLVYQPEGVAEPVFAMLRFRLAREAPTAPGAPDAAAQHAAFSRLFAAAFLHGGAPLPAIDHGEAAGTAAAVGAFVRSVLTFRDPQHAALAPALAEINVESRVGAGSHFDAEGHYLDGTAWGFTTAAVRVEGTGTTRTVHVVDTPLPGVVLGVQAAPGGERYAPVCPPQVAQGGAGREALCLHDGTVATGEPPAGGTEGPWQPARLDATGLHRDFLAGLFTPAFPLRDPRRRAFDLQGMTCVQCHTRNFDDGVYTEVQATNPRAQSAVTPAHDSSRVAYTVLPVHGVHGGARTDWLTSLEAHQLDLLLSPAAPAH